MKNYLSFAVIIGLAISMQGQTMGAQTSNGEVTGIGPALATVIVGQPVTLTVLGTMIRGSSGCRLTAGPVGNFQDMGVVTRFPSPLPKPLVFNQPGTYVVHVYGGTSDPQHVCTGSKSISLQVKSLPTATTASPQIAPLNNLVPSNSLPGAVLPSAMPQMMSAPMPALVKAKLTSLSVDGVMLFGNGSTQVNYSLAADRPVAACEVSISTTTLNTGANALNVPVGQGYMSLSIPAKSGINFGTYPLGKYRLRIVAKPVSNAVCEGDVFADFTVTQAPPPPAAVPPAGGMALVPAASEKITVSSASVGEALQKGADDMASPGSPMQVVPAVQVADGGTTGKSLQGQIATVSAVESVWYSKTEKAIRYRLEGTNGKVTCTVAVDLSEENSGLSHKSNQLIGGFPFIALFTRPAGYPPGGYKVTVTSVAKGEHPGCILANNKSYLVGYLTLTGSDVDKQLPILDIAETSLLPLTVGKGTTHPVSYTVTAAESSYGSHEAGARCNASVVVTHQTSGAAERKRTAFPVGNTQVNITELMKPHGGFKPGKYTIEIAAGPENFNNADGASNTNLNCSGVLAQTKKTLTVSGSGSSIEGVVWSAGPVFHGPGYFNNTDRHISITAAPLISGDTFCRYAIYVLGASEPSATGYFDPVSKKTTGFATGTIYSSKNELPAEIFVQGWTTDSIPACKGVFTLKRDFPPSTSGTN